MPFTLNLPRRIILVIYCVFLCYCLVWIPWQSTTAVGSRNLIEINYSLLWRVPDCYCATLEPDLRLIAVRIGLVTAITGAAFLLAGIQRKRPR
jgi:hypothetical protein